MAHLDELFFFVFVRHAALDPTEHDVCLAMAFFSRAFYDFTTSSFHSTHARKALYGFLVASRFRLGVSSM